MLRLKTLRHGLLAIGVLAACVAQAVDLNLASHLQLESIRGIGPKMTERILDNRAAHGAFTSWQDFATRVKGVGTKKLMVMQKDGLTLKGFPVEFASEPTKTAPQTGE